MDTIVERQPKEPLVEWVVPIWGIQIPDDLPNVPVLHLPYDEFNWSDLRMTIGGFTDDLRAHLQDCVDEYTRAGPSRFDFTSAGGILSYQAPRGVPQHPHLLKGLSLVGCALSFLSPFVSISRAYCLAPRGGTMTFRPMVISFAHHDSQVDREVVDRVRDDCAILARISDADRYLRAAIREFGLACLQPDDRDAIAKYVLCGERLGRIAGPGMKKKYSAFVASRLATNPSEAAALRDRAKILYEIRSRAVHGEEPADREHLTPFGRKYRHAKTWAYEITRDLFRIELDHTGASASL